MDIPFGAIRVLDHGYVQLVESWGSDERIVESARMSTDKGFRGWGDETKPGDEKFLSYLYSHQHMSPFEMAGMTIEVCAPIFVFREWHRHRTFSYNELSGRYTKIPDFDYMPEMERLLEVNQASSNKQSQGIAPKQLDEKQAALWLDRLRVHYKQAEELYKYGLEIGLAKELARIPLTVSRYSKMRASGNLRNWLHFTELRSDIAAQKEIRVYSDTILQLIQKQFPHVHQLLQTQK